MWSDFPMLRDMRARLRAVLPERAFLRRDRGEALFVSNAPAFDPSLPAIPGFILERRGSLVHILPDESWVSGLENAFAEAPDALSRSLLRFRGLSCERSGLLLFSAGLKIIDMGASAAANEIEAYDISLRRSAALALRGGPGGGLYAAALLNHHIRKGE